MRSPRQCHHRALQQNVFNTPPALHRPDHNIRRRQNLIPAEGTRIRTVRVAIILIDVDYRRLSGAQNPAARVFLGAEQFPHFLASLQTALHFVACLHPSHLMGGHAYYNPDAACVPFPTKASGDQVESGLLLA